jgi:HAD superfamily phosphatase (TIGR01668 family)
MGKKGLRRLSPDLYLRNIYELPLRKFMTMGIKVLLFDLDNTVVLHRDSHALPQTAAWFEKLSAAGFEAAILSNNSDERVKIIASQFKIPYIAHAGKPRQKGFKRALALFGVKPEQCVMVGDQLFTDIAGGNQAGFFTALIMPLGRDEHWGVRNISRRAEKICWRFFVKETKTP